MSIASGQNYTVELHVPNVKLSELNKYKIYNQNDRKIADKDIYKIELDELSFNKDDDKLEINRLVTNYTGTLFSDDRIDYNKLLPSDLELFTSNVTNSVDDNPGTSTEEFSDYNKVVYINSGSEDILKIQLNSSYNSEVTESKLELYKEDVLVITVIYENTMPPRSHLITLTSQPGTDAISCIAHEAEDPYINRKLNEVNESTSTDRYFSSGKGIPHYKVSDCNISYIISDTVKNIMSETCINNHEYLKRSILNNSCVTGQNKKYFLGIPQE